MFNYFKLLNLFRENRVAWKGGRVRAGAVVQQPSQTQRTGEEAQPEDGEEKPEGKAAEVKAETKKGLAEAKHDVRKGTVGEETKQEIKDLHKHFEEAKKKIDVMKISKARREAKVDANSLVPNTNEGIDNVVDIFKRVLLLDKDSVNWMEQEFRAALTKAESKESADKRQLFVNADKHLDQCRGEFGEGFYYAYKYFQAVKGLIAEYQPQDKASIDNFRKKDSDPILTTAADKGTEIVHDVMKAVEERDYAKMALYGIAGYSFYKIWKDWISPKLSSKKEGDFPWGGLLLAGTGIYCGLSIFAPDTLKKIWGKGIHADAKGTAAEDLQNLLKDNSAAAENGVEVGVLAAVLEADVKDVFAPMISFSGNGRYDAESSDAKMIQLTNPGLINCFDSEVRAAGPVYPNRPPFEKRTPMQKAYAKACERLYQASMWLKEEWDTRVLASGDPEIKTKFEDMFLKETSVSWKMADLYRKLGTFSSRHAIETPFTTKLTDEAEKFLNGEAGKEGMFEETDNVEILTPTNDLSYMDIRVMGFPFTLKLKSDSEGNRRYLFYPSNDVLPSSTPLAEVDANNPESVKEGRLAVTRKVKNTMDKLLDKYDIEGTSGKEAIKYEAGEWTAEVTMPAVEKYGKKIPARKIKAKTKVGADGESITFLDVDSNKPIYYVGESMKANYDYAPTLLNEMIFEQGDFDALKPMFQANKIIFKEDPNSTSEFDLLFGDGELSLRIKVNKDGKFESVDPAKEKDLIQSERFRTQYVEAFSEQYLGFFENMKKQVDKMPQSYFLYFPESMTKWFSGLKADKWLNADSDVISGSIPNYFTYMLIDSKRDALKYRLFWKMAGATSFKGVETAKTGIFDQLTKMEHFANGKFLETMKGKNRDSWSRDEFMMKIVEPFRSAGTSRIYLSSIDYFENSMFKKIGYGGERGGDISEKSHALAGQLLSAFYYYTAEHDADFKEGSPEEIKFENYCHYVADELFNQYDEPTKLTPNIPPENFKIVKFGEWERNPLNNSDKLKGVDADGKLTVEQIEEKLSAEYEDVRNKFLKNRSVNDISMEKIKGKIAKLKIVGPQGKTPLRGRAEDIDSLAHSRKKQQLELIQDAKMNFLQELYEDHATSGVWKNLSMKETFDVWYRRITM